MESCIKTHVEPFFIPWFPLFSVSHLHVMLIFHCPNMSGSYIYFWILTVPCIQWSKGCSLKLLPRSQLDKPSLIVKSPKFSLVNGFWNNEFILWPSSVLNFDWLKLFCWSHCFTWFIARHLPECHSLFIKITISNCLRQFNNCIFIPFISRMSWEMLESIMPLLLLFLFMHM